MKVAFWNVNMGMGSFAERPKTFAAWCKWAAPDLLILEEVSFTLLKGKPTELEKLSGMAPLDFVYTLDKNLEESTKCLAALGDANSFTAKAIAIRIQDARRMGLKVNRKYSDICLWGLHANASHKGGAAAIRAAAEYLERDLKAVWGGDFNYPIKDCPADKIKVCPPAAWDGSPLAFSQWNKEGFGNPKDLSSWHLPTQKLYEALKPNTVIDYVAFGADRTVTALPNCKDEEMWRDILSQFDHCPVMYDIN